MFVEKVWIKMWKIGEAISRHKLNFFALHDGEHSACGKDIFSTREKIFESEKKSKNLLDLSSKSEKSMSRGLHFSKIFRKFPRN